MELRPVLFNKGKTKVKGLFHQWIKTRHDGVDYIDGIVEDDEGNVGMISISDITFVDGECLKSHQKLVSLTPWDD